MRYCYGKNMCVNLCTDSKAYICCADCTNKTCFWRCHDLDNNSTCRYMTTKDWVDNVGSKIKLGFTSSMKTTSATAQKTKEQKEITNSENETQKVAEKTVSQLSVSSLAKKYNIPYQRFLHL